MMATPAPGLSSSRLDRIDHLARACALSLPVTWTGPRPGSRQATAGHHRVYRDRDCDWQAWRPEPGSGRLDRTDFKFLVAWPGAPSPSHCWQLCRCCGDGVPRPPPGPPGPASRRGKPCKHLQSDLTRTRTRSCRLDRGRAFPARVRVHLTQHCQSGGPGPTGRPARPG